MEGQTVVNDLLAQVGTLSGNAFALDEDGLCNLTYDDLDLVIAASADSEIAYFYSFVLPVPEDGQETLYAKVLKENLLCEKGRGAYFALNEDGDWIMLVYARQIKDLDFPLFESIIKNLIDISQEFQQSLSVNISSKVKKKPRDDDMLGNLGLRV